MAAAVASLFERASDAATGAYSFWRNRPWMQARAALAAAVCGALVGGLAGILLQVIACAWMFHVVAAKHNYRDRGVPYLNDEDRVMAVGIALLSSVAAAIGIGTSGAASLTFIAGTGAAMERNAGAMKKRESLSLRAAWVASIALLAFIVPAVVRVWSAPGLGAGTDTGTRAGAGMDAGTDASTGTGADADVRLFGVNNAFAAAAVAATALALDSPFKSLAIGAYALFAAFAGATFGGHFHPDFVSSTAQSLELVLLAMLTKVNHGVGLACGAAYFVANMHGATRTLLNIAWTLALVAAATVSFWTLAGDGEPYDPQPREVTRLLIATCPGIYLATGLPLTPERVMLGGAALVSLGLLVEAAFGQVATEWDKKLAAQTQEIQNARAQVQQLEAQLARQQSDRLCCVCQDAAASHACLPCGHRSSCRACLEIVRASAEPSCPVCRRHIESIAHIYDAV